MYRKYIFIFYFRYKAECTPNGASITRDFGGIPGVWVSSKTDEKVEFIDGLAGVVNRGVDLILESEPIIPFNFLSIDFAHDGIIESIIRSNINSAGAKTISMNDPTYTTSVALTVPNDDEDQHMLDDSGQAVMYTASDMSLDMIGNGEDIVISPAGREKDALLLTPESVSVV